MSNMQLEAPPHNIEAEQAVLGGILLRPDSFDDVTDILEEDDFYSLSHKTIWKAITDMANKSIPCDIITLAEHLERNGILSDIGDMQYLSCLNIGTASAANIKRYASIVSNLSAERKTLSALHSSLEVMYSDGDTHDKLSAVVSQVQDASESKQRGSGPVRVSSELSSWIEKLEYRFENKGKGIIPGISTGLVDLDNMTAGLQNGDMFVVAGRPSMGKTILAQNLCEYASVELGIPSLLFSMEMPKDQIINRSASSLARIKSDNIRTGDMEDSDWPRLTPAISKLNAAPLFIDDTPALTPTELRSRARKMKRKEGIRLIAIDYLQLMRVPGYRNDRVHEIEEISRSLKAMAKELDVPVVVLSQLNRSVDARADKRPLMSDLRESGAIEQDADVIAFIYRDEVYNEDSPHKGIAELIIRKQRNGKTGTVKVISALQFYRFDNFDGRHIEDAPPISSKWSGGFDPDGVMQ